MILLTWGIALHQKGRMFAQGRGTCHSRPKPGYRPQRWVLFAEAWKKRTSPLRVCFRITSACFRFTRALMLALFAQARSTGGCATPTWSRCSGWRSSTRRTSRR
eukprot:2642801-Pyramimonas_sp.AAC.2